MNGMSAAIMLPRGPVVRIDRDFLMARLPEIDRSRVTTIVAPAGYGKTVSALALVDALAAQGRPVLWVAARAGVGTLADLLSTLNAAAVAAGIACDIDSSDASPAKTFAQAMAAHRARPVLVLDAVEMLGADAREFLSQLVIGSRDELTTILISRSRKTIPIARLRSLGYLVEIGTADLQFSTDEARALVEVAGAARIEEERLQQIVRETEGWPAGVAMAVALYNRELEGTGEAPHPAVLRRQFESYFDEEVLSDLDESVRKFLISTVVLEDLTPAGCAALTGDENARLMLEAVEEHGLFLRCVDADTIFYRYHPLFRQTVLRQLNDRQPGLAAELHQRASQHFAREGNALKAVEHARLCGDPIFLADQLEAQADQLVYSGYLYLIDSLVGLLPRGVFERRPHLALAIAWRRIRSLSYDAAELLIGLADEELQRRIAEDRDIIENRRLERAIEHRRLMLAAARDDMKLIKDRAEVLLREFGDSEPYLSCTLLAQLMASRRELYHFQDMLRLEAEVQRALNRPGSDFAAIALKASIAPTLAAQGKTDVAESLLRQALDYARQVGGTGVAAIPALPLAEILYDRGEHAEAKRLVDEYLPVAREWGFIDQISSGFLVRARLQFNANDHSGAIATLDDMQRIAIDRDLERLRAYAVSEQVRMMIQSGNIGEARTVLRNSGLLPDGEPIPTLNPTRRLESIATSVIRLAIEEHRLGDARRLAKRWKDFVRTNSAIRSVLIFDLLLAEIAVRAGDYSEARRSVREAVTLAAGAEWTQLFCDEGASIRGLITEIYGTGPELDSPPDRFGRLLVGIFAKSAEGWRESEDEEEEKVFEVGLTGRLVSREVDILRMVGGGLRNREIGDRLGLTEGTVKWYMQQIYDKLGVRRRPQAVNRARQLGVLA
jgi:LuxR family maltose regulon positive regulatory protein